MAKPLLLLIVLSFASTLQAATTFTVGPFRQVIERRPEDIASDALNRKSLGNEAWACELFGQAMPRESLNLTDFPLKIVFSYLTGPNTGSVSVTTLRAVELPPVSVLQVRYRSQFYFEAERVVIDRTLSADMEFNCRFLRRAIRRKLRGCWAPIGKVIQSRAFGTLREALSMTEAKVGEVLE